MGYSKIQTNSISIKPSIQNSISLKNVNLISNGNDIFSYPLSNNDELSFIKFNGQLPYNSIVPHKYGEYSLSGSVFASGFANNDVAPYKAFTYNTTDKWQVDTITGIIGYEFTEPKLIYKYEISCHSLTNINMAPKTWTFEGYNEDTFVWDVLDTQTDIVLTATNFTRTIFITNPTTKYKKYRLNITVNNGNATSLSINHIKLYEVYDKLDMNNKVRIELDERTKLYLYKITNGVCDIYEKNSVYEFVIPNTNQEYFIYFYLNDNGSIVFEGNNIYNFKQNSFPLCSINSFNNSIINMNKLNKFNTSIIYDVFKVKTPIPASAIRQHATSSNINNILYIICGTALTSRNDAYNTNLDLWTTKANSLYTGFTLSSSTHLTNIHMMGGYTTGVLNRNTLYNETLDSWENKTNMLVGRYKLSQTTHLSNIYSMFGATSVSTNTNHKYDINIDSWSSTLTQAPNVNSFTSTVAYQNIIYAICGFEFIGSLNYNIITDIWGVKSTKPTRSFNGACNIINNDYILYIGGASSTNINSVSQNIEVYSILNDTWYTYYKTSLFSLYMHTASCVVDNNIFIINYYSNPTTQVYTPPKLL